MDSLKFSDNKELVERLQIISNDLQSRWQPLSATVAEAQPTANEWSIKEIVCHLQDAEQITLQRIRQMLEEDEPFLRSFNPDELATEHDYPSQSWQVALANFCQTRQSSLDLLRELEPVQWLKGGIHQERGHVTIRHLAEYLCRHTQEHLDQAEKFLRGF